MDVMCACHVMIKEELPKVHVLRCVKMALSPVCVCALEMKEWNHSAQCCLGQR